MSRILWAIAVMVLALAPAGVAVFRHLARRLRLTERVLLAIALAPFALAVPALAFALIVPRVTIGQCFWQSEFVWAVIALWPRRPAPPEISEPLPNRGEGFPALAAGGAAIVLAVLIAAIPLAVPYVRMWSDAWFHTAAILEIGLRGVPPQDPNFAGIPLYYFWFFHFTLALLGTVDGVSPFHNQVFLNVWSAVVLVLATAQVAYRAFGRAAAAWAGAIVVLGLNPFGWLYAIARSLVGETRGLGETIASLNTITGVELAMSWFFPHNHVSMLNRFWTGTAQTPAIALGAATAWSIVRGLDRPTRGAWLRSFLLALATLAFHPAYGALAMAALGLALLVLAIRGERRGAAAAGIAALVVAALAALPYIRACSVPGATTPARLGLYAPNLRSLALAIAPWWIVAWPAFRARDPRPATRLVTLTAAIAVAMAIVVVLPELNSEKLFYLAWVSLAPIIAGGFVLWSERLRLPAIARLTIAALLIVPTSGLYGLGAAMDRRSPGTLMEREGPGARGRPLETADEAEAYAFLRAATEPDAAVIEAPLPWVNQPVPILGERRLFCGRLDVYLANHFGGESSPSPALHVLMEEFEVRRGIQRALFGSGDIEEAQRLYLAHFGAPIYLLVRSDEAPRDVWEGFRRRPEWAEVFANRQVRIYRFTRAAS
jgi:hypothetical protein